MTAQLAFHTTSFMTRSPSDPMWHHVPGFPIRYCKRAHVRKAILDAGRQPDSVPGVAGSSDLIPGKYEGGFKVWESTADLLTWITENPDLIRNKVILDLGCGAGLVGIACLMAGAGQVTFHDFNDVVIEFFTKANVRVNFCVDDDDDAKDQLPKSASFASGDWSDFHSDAKFDLIFTSETIYDEKSYDNLLSLLKRSLKSDGTVMIGAKTCYFGVGGGTRSFEQFVDQDKSMSAQSVRHIPAPVQREILQMQFL
jgi:SAM-dependent methyltransferase